MCMRGYVRARVCARSCLLQGRVSTAQGGPGDAGAAAAVAHRRRIPRNRPVIREHASRRLASRRRRVAPRRRAGRRARGRNLGCHAQCVQNDGVEDAAGIATRVGFRIGSRWMGAHSDTTLGILQILRDLCSSLRTGADVYVRACVRASERARVRACVCARARVGICVAVHLPHGTLEVLVFPVEISEILAPATSQRDGRISPCAPRSQAGSAGLPGPRLGRVVQHAGFGAARLSGLMRIGDLIYMLVRPVPGFFDY
jgi:hypothetical protein